MEKLLERDLLRGITLVDHVPWKPLNLRILEWFFGSCKKCYEVALGRDTQFFADFF